MSILTNIQAKKKQQQPLLAILIDPDKHEVFYPLLPYLNQVDLILVGGSTGTNIEPCIATLRQHTQVPLLLFPGNIQQFTPSADALLFLSLLNARTADMLITPHIQMAIPVLESGIETIAMGYILIDGGRKSSVEIVSNCTPIPQDDIKQIISTAVAGQLLGKQLIYLEAGSGAKNPVSTHIIQSVHTHLQVPLIVGGGICTPSAMLDAFEAGADVVVIGNHFEKSPEEICDFIRIKREKYG
jgi:putative glycerol-1-phosphate prenyltransferase